MYEATSMLNTGMIVFLFFLFIAASILIVLMRAKPDFSKERLKIFIMCFSYIPLIFNTVLWLLFFASGFFISSEMIMLTIIFAVIFCAAASAVAGPALELLGIYFSVCIVKKFGKKGMIHIFISGISMISSLLFLTIFLIALVPLALKYYGYG